MSKLETPMTHRYWKRVGGTLLEEYLVVPSSAGVGWRRIDGIIIMDGEHRIASGAEKRSVSLDGHDLIIVQTKASRLGMSLLAGLLLARVGQEEAAIASAGEKRDRGEVGRDGDDCRRTATGSTEGEGATVRAALAG
jgi:hypothetical protein